MNSHFNFNSNDSLFIRWRKKFACALRGIAVGVRDQNSFSVHLPAAVVVVALAWWLELSIAEWSILALCITVVLAAELFNSALEHLARAITRDEDPEVRDALDIASGAVLVTAIGAAVVGVLLLLRPLWSKLF